jgi:membrane protein implicated in regulation of membrane protease activity
MFRGDLIMQILFGIIALIFLICLIVGLKNPKVITVWRDDFKTRKNVLIYFGIPLAISFFLFVGISINSYYKVKKIQENLKIEVDKKVREIQNRQKSYLGVLDSEKTYEQMSFDEKDNADSLITYWDNLEQDFKDKYQSRKETIETSKSEYVEAKKKADAEAKVKAKEEADAKAAAEAAKKAEEERIGYDTGITYNQLARTPDDYKGKKAKFTGKVIQVMEGDKETNLRIAIDGNYDTVLFVGYDPKITSTRVLENDNVTVKGKSIGIYSYKSTIGGKISIPGMWVDNIVINNK